jgi:hypothetical protein
MYAVVAKSDKGYPEIFLVKPNVMSQWGEPLYFRDKEDARHEAAEWAALLESRTLVVRPKKDRPPVPFPPVPRRSIIVSPPRRRIILAVPERKIIKRV